MTDTGELLVRRRFAFHRVAVRPCVDQRMMPAVMRVVILFGAFGVEHLANVNRLPASGGTVEQIAQEIPIATVVETQPHFGFRFKLREPRNERHA